MVLPVDLVDDDIYELTESFSASLSALSLPPFITLGPDAATATVADDDCKWVGFLLRYTCLFTLHIWHCFDCLSAFKEIYWLLSLILGF